MTRKMTLTILVVLAVVPAEVCAGSDDPPNPATETVPTPKDPLFPGFFVACYCDDAPTVGMLMGCFKTFAEARMRADGLLGKKVAFGRCIKVEIDWDDDDGVGHLRVYRSGESSKVMTGEMLARTAKSLAADLKYLPDGKATRCSEFVRDFARKLLGKDVPELEKRAADQFDAMKDSERWRALKFQDHPGAVFREAQALANQGSLVVVAWKNPHPTPTDSGHVAVVVPFEGKDKDLHPSSTWEMKVPYIAQAGSKLSRRDNQAVFSYLPLSEGFGADKKDEMEIFVLRDP
jgi:hypothetical protein